MACGWKRSGDFFLVQFSIIELKREHKKERTQKGKNNKREDWEARRFKGDDTLLGAQGRVSLLKIFFYLHNKESEDSTK